MNKPRAKTFNYAIGMFGTSIPINMLKTYAFTFLCGSDGGDHHAMGHDAADLHLHRRDRQPRLRFPLRPDALPLGPPASLADDRHAAADPVVFIAFYNMPAFLAGNSLFAYCMLFYILTGTLDSVINANYGALFPELFRDDASRAKTNALRQAFQLVAMIISIALTPMVTENARLQPDRHPLRHPGRRGHPLHDLHLPGKGPRAGGSQARTVESPQGPVHQPKFWIAGFANAFYSAAMSLVLASMPFFVKYALGLSSGTVHLPVGGGPAHRHRRCGRLGLAGQEVLADAGLAGGAGRPGGRPLSRSILPTRWSTAIIFSAFVGFRLCRRDHHHGPDRRQDHGRGHPEARPAAGGHHLQCDWDS